METVKDAVGEILIEEEPLQARIRELGAEISQEYEGRDLLLVGVLKGAVFFMADLMREGASASARRPDCSSPQRAIA